MQNRDEIQTIADILPVNAGRCPHKTAVLEMDQSGAPRETSYAELKAEVDVFAALLAAQGVRRSDRVAIVMPNCRHWIVAYFGILRLGAVVVPLEYEFLHQAPDQVQFVLAHSEARFVVAHPADGAAIKELETEGELTLVPLPVSGASPPRAAAPAPPQLKPSDVAQILYTSGTTGRKKGVVLTHRNIIFNVEKCCEGFRVRPHYRVAAFLPFHHAFPLTTTVVLPLYAGALLAVGDFRDRKTRQFLHDSKPTMVVGVPRVFESLLAGLEASARREGSLGKLLKARALSARIKRLTGLNVGKVFFRELHRRLFGGRQLRFCVCGGARLPAEVQRDYFALGIPLLQGWGMTEISPVGTVQPYRPLKFYFTRYYEANAGSIGTPLGETSIHLADQPEMDICVERDGRGEMVVQGEHIMREYYKDPEETNRRKSPAGLKTGDIARRSPGGEYFIVGRAKHVIVLPSGKKVFPEEDLLEDIERCGCVEECTARPVRQEGSEAGEKIGIIIKPEMDYLRTKGVSTVGELYALLKDEITAALAHKPDYMKRFEFCVTELTADGFSDLVVNSMGKVCPLKNAFSFERSYRVNKDSTAPLEI